MDASPTAIAAAPIRHLLACLGNAARPAITGLLCLASVLLAGPRQAAGQALTPESEEVRAAVEKGMQFLMTVEQAEADKRPIHEQMGRDCLVALALIKGHSDPEGNKNHPLVKRAVDGARSAMRNSEFTSGYGRIYSTSLAIILFSALGAKDHQGDISTCLNVLLSFQDANGGFRDSSMSQYATLALWEAQKSGARVPADAWQNLARFWTQGQEDSGEFSYMPGVDNAIRPTLSVGGLGSLYICYTVGNRAKQAEDAGKGNSQDDGVATALKPVGGREEEKKEEVQTVNLNLATLSGAMQRGDGWYRGWDNKPPINYKYYFYYGVERYQAFREVVRNDFPAEPAWYTEIARRILNEQAEDGSWRSSADGRSPGLIGTSYAILFLVRSTKMRPQAMGDGRLVAGRGIPNLDAQTVVSGGRIRIKPLQGPAEELIKIISDPQSGQYYEALAGLEELVAEADKAQLNKHLVRFREIAEGSDPKAKAAAITGIARARSLDDVPFLIYALSDDNSEVVLAADDGLRFISRKFEGVGLQPDATVSERAEAIEAWKKWYLTIRPNAVFDR